MHRTFYPMDSFSCVTMETGLLQTLAQFTVFPGDSVSLDAAMINRASPLRRQNIVDPQIEYLAFYVPHRHIYPNWQDFLKEGIDENQTLASVTRPQETPLNSNSYLGFSWGLGETIPLHALAGYNQIWNRYFRIPSDNSSAQGFGLLADNYRIPSGTSINGDSRYGHRCAFPKTIFNTGLIDEGVTDEDSQVPVVSGSIDVKTIEQIKARYGSEISRAWFAASADTRYSDLLKAVYGTPAVNVDADKRPTLLMHKSGFLTGGDVNGTAEGNLGEYSGKGLSNDRFGFPSRFFREHGTIWIMALARFPLMVYGESNYLTRKANPSYKEIGGDPRIIGAEPPQNVKDVQDVIFQLPSFPDEKEKVPYGNWYRTNQAAYVHEDFGDVQGFPFLSSGDFTTSYRDLHYVDPNDYTPIYRTTQLGHMQMYSKLGWGVKRLVPSAFTSVFTGT